MRGPRVDGVEQPFKSGSRSRSMRPRPSTASLYPILYASLKTANRFTLSRRESAWNSQEMHEHEHESTSIYTHVDAR